MFLIQRGNIEAQMHGSGSNDKILEGDGDSLGGLFTLDASGKLGYGQRDWMHDQIAENTFGEGASALAVVVCSGSVDTVRQFHSADCRERNIDLPMRGPCLTENIFDGLTTAVACDEDAGIENKAHGINPKPTCREVCGCG